MLRNIVVMGPVLIRINNNGTIDLINTEGSHSFKAIKRKISDLNTANSVSATTTTTTTTVARTTATTTTAKKYSLKEPLTEALKEQFISNFNELDKQHFWYLTETKSTAGNQILSVEEKLFNYGVKCNYLHPIHSFVVDLGDTTLEEIFTAEELLKLQEFGNNLLVHPVEKKLGMELEKMERMSNTLEVYDYYRKIDFNPVSNPLIAWLSMSVSNTSFNFINNEPLPAVFESDNMYLYWNFLNSICYYSKIQAISKEKASQANSKATNVKRKLSSIEEIGRKAVGRKMDSVYIGANLELGALEIGSNKNNDTKDLSDGYYKMPIVMKDMLDDIVGKYTELRNDVNIIGYNIQNNNLSYMNMDIPAGYVTRIRRLKKLPYPTSNDDYITRMPALLKIAYYGYKTMNHTLLKIRSSKSQIAPVILPEDNFKLPPTIKSSPISSSKSTSSSLQSKSSSPTTASSSSS